MRWQILATANRNRPAELIYRTEQQHTHVEWLRFLTQIDRETPEDVPPPPDCRQLLHSQARKVVSWLKKHQRFHMHFIPTWNSWMNMVGRFFADLKQDCVRAGSFMSVAKLIEAITAYLACRNENPKSYKWKADGTKTLDRIQRAREALEMSSFGAGRLAARIEWICPMTIVVDSIR